MYIGLHVKYLLFLYDLTKFEKFPDIFEKLRYQISWKSIQWDRQTGRRDENSSRFLRFCEKRLKKKESRIKIFLKHCFCLLHVHTIHEIITH